MAAAMEKAGSADPASTCPCLPRRPATRASPARSPSTSKGDIKNGALTIHTYKDGKSTDIAVVR